MNNTIALKTKQFHFNFIHLVVFIAVTASIFILTNIFTEKHLAGNTEPVEFTIEDLQEIAEEIYDAGAITEAVKDLPLAPALIDKMSEEISKILTKTSDCGICEVYFLRTYENGYFPILAYGNIILGAEFMNANDVWKVGFTCNGENQRYPNDVYYSNNSSNILLTRTELRYEQITRGAYKQMLILEKILIYSYPVWSGHTTLVRTPGCKIFR